MKNILLLLISLCVFRIQAQVTHLGIMFNNNVSSFPVKGYPKVFYSAFHPGADLVLAQRVNTHPSKQIWFETNIGGFYHRVIQIAIKINFNFHYRRYK